MRIRPLTPLLALGLVASVCKPVTIKKFKIEPLYACTGEPIRFEWDIGGINTIKIYKNGTDRIHTDDRKGTWTSPPVRPDWDYLRFKGCRGGSCRSFSFDIHIIDNPKWTREYVANAAGGQPGGALEIIGGPEVVDNEPDPSSQSAEGMYRVHRQVDGYRINPPDSDFSPRARVLQARPSRIDNALFPVDVGGMFVESSGNPAMPKMWAAEGVTVGLASPAPPRDRFWYLYYPESQKVLTAVQYGQGREADKYPTEPTLYPAISYYVKCLDAP